MKAKLLKEHTHAGKLYPVGSVIELDQDLYEWLANLKVAIYCSEAVEVPAVAVNEPEVVAPAVEAVSTPGLSKKRFWGRSPVSDAPSEPNEV